MRNTRRSRAAEWLEELKALDHSLGRTTDAATLVRLCVARDAHMHLMPAEARVYIAYPTERDA